jgi:serine/threonine protein kinase
MIESGTLLQNRYLLTDQIGQGGMGAVYIATDQRFGSTVAVKETFFTDPNLRKAFEREARLLNSLRHTALPRVSDHFVESDGQFLVMEFIPGEDLSALLEKNGGPFPVDRVLGWADQLLDALEYLHEQTPSIIHRDIKPQNLKLTDRDHIILLDFGLAKGAPSNLSRVTNTGSVFGYSRSYAPLEQIQGAGTDTRSDLYSLAATLYHLLTGVTPPDAVTRATAVINGQPDPLRPASEINPKVSAGIANVLTNALAQNANQRPASARAMAHALETADRTPGIGRATEGIGGQPTIFDQATQILTPRTEPMTDAVPFAALGAANTVPDPKLQGTDPQGRDTGDDSVLTVVAESNKPAGGSNWNRALAAVAGVVLLAGGAFGVYRYTHRTPAATTNPGEPTQTVTLPVAPVQTSPTPVAGAPTPAPTAAPGQTTGQKTKPVTPKHVQPNGEPDDPDDVPDPDDEAPPPRGTNGRFPQPPEQQGPPNADQDEIKRERQQQRQQRQMQIQIQRDMRRQQLEERRRRKVKNPNQ